MRAIVALTLVERLSEDDDVSDAADKRVDRWSVPELQSPSL